MTKLPEHTTTNDGNVVVLTFAEPLHGADETAVHRHLAAAHPGASIATTGTNQVTVTPVPRTPAPRQKKLVTK